jgi:hypothetical protein
MDSLPPRPSKSAAAARRALIERARARTPEERILLALELGTRCRLLAEIRRRTRGEGA